MAKKLTINMYSLNREETESKKTREFATSSEIHLQPGLKKTRFFKEKVFRFLRFFL